MFVSNFIVVIMKSLLKLDLRAAYYGCGKLAKKKLFHILSYVSPRHGQSGRKMKWQRNKTRFMNNVWQFDRFFLAGYRFLLVSIWDYHMFCVKLLNLEKVEIQNWIKMDITNKPSLNSMHFSEHEWSGFICEYLRIHRQFNFEHVAAARSAWPDPDRGTALRQAYSLYAAGRTAPPHCRYVTACGHQWMKSSFIHQDSYW